MARDRRGGCSCGRLLRLPLRAPGAEQAPWTPTEHIAALRERYAGETFEVTGDIVVEGVVTSDDTRGNFYRSLCIEEQGAAIEIMTGTDHLHNDYPRGCRVVLRLRQLAVGESRGVLQAGRMPAPGAATPPTTSARRRRSTGYWPAAAAR